MIPIGPLSAEQRRAVNGLRRRAVGRVSQRAHRVWLSARGYTVPQIAQIFEVGEDTVRTGLHRCQEGGVDGRADRPRPGRASLLRRAIRRATAAWSRAAGRPGC